MIIAIISSNGILEAIASALNIEITNINSSVSDHGLFHVH